MVEVSGKEIMLQETIDHLNGVINTQQHSMDNLNNIIDQMKKGQLVDDLIDRYTFKLNLCQDLRLRDEEKIRDLKNENNKLKNLLKIKLLKLVNESLEI